MRVVVPYAGRHPKTRLDEMFSRAERTAFARAMLADVLDAVTATGHDVELVATQPVSEFDVPVVVDERPLTSAVNDVLAAADGPVAVVMADLALATPDVFEELFDAPGDVVVAPGRGGGTNALVVRHPEFRVDYHGASYLDHREIARDVGAELAVVDSHRLATDIDEIADLGEVLVHGDGRAREWLEAAGVTLAVSEGRVGVQRK